jgi:hypothetical protein
MLLFGVSYAVASLSCTLPAFLATTSSTFSRSGTVSGLVTYAAYGLGMGLIVGTLTLAVALARAGVVRNMRRLVPYVNRVSGALVLVAGLYVSYYGWYEVRLDRLGPGDDPADPVVDRALRIQRALSDWIDRVGTARLGLACAVLLAGGVTTALLLRHGRPGTTTPTSPPGAGATPPGAEASRSAIPAPLEPAPAAADTAETAPPGDRASPVR